MANNQVSVNATDIAKTITINVRVKNAKLMSWRFRLAAPFFVLGAYIAGTSLGFVTDGFDPID